ncbi:MAG TPA: cell division protein FtsH, partial [Acetobacteraceae bacterium]|nr:cell division protein FtsH [Acetobacteraceae bacterium]
TARLIDSEIRGLIDQAYARAKQILTENIEELHRLARGLLEHETLSGEEILQVIRGEPVVRNRTDEPATPTRGSVPTSGRPSPRPPGLNPGAAPAT